MNVEVVPQDAQAYSGLKQTLASRHLNEIEAYMDGKDAFIWHVEPLKGSGLWRD